MTRAMIGQDSPSYRAALLSLWAATAQRTNERLSRNFLRGRLQHRLSEVPIGAIVHDEETAVAAIAVVASGSPSKRPFGIEVLRISPGAVDLSRVEGGTALVLDNHCTAKPLGRIVNAWIEGSELRAEFIFDRSAEARKAQCMIERGEVGGISAGYRVDQWVITDQYGRVIDPETDHIRSDEDLTYTAVRWRLNEISICTIPSDPAARIIRTISGAETRSVTYERAAGIGWRAAAEARARMQARHDHAIAAHYRKRSNAPAWWRRRPHYRVTHFAT